MCDVAMPTQTANVPDDYQLCHQNNVKPDLSYTLKSCMLNLMLLPKLKQLDKLNNIQYLSKFDFDIFKCKYARNR